MIIATIRPVQGFGWIYQSRPPNDFGHLPGEKWARVVADVTEMDGNQYRDETRLQRPEGPQLVGLNIQETWKAILVKTGT
jgi:hypothetical protein